MPVERTNETIMSGIDKIDAIAGGFQTSDLVLVCGRPGMGKSTLLKHIVLNRAQRMVRNKTPEYVLFLSLQKTRPLRNVPRFRGIPNIQDEAVILVNQPLLGIDDIIETIREQKKRCRLTVVAIDYLQLIATNEPAASDQKQETTSIVRRLKELAVEDDLCILLGAQLWRTVDKCRDHVPLLSDLAIIGDIEPLADTVIFLLRPYHVIGMQGTSPEILPGPTTVIIPKARHGKAGTCELRIKEFGDPPDMFSWHWNILPLTDDANHEPRPPGFFDSRLLSLYRLRRDLRWLHFGSPEESAPEDLVRQSNEYVIDGLRMDDKGFSRMNAGLRWTMAADDPILDHDTSACFLAFDQSRVPEQCNAVCPLDGYVTTMNDESYYRLLPGEHFTDEGPDAVYRLCPHCLMELASKMLIRRCRPVLD